MNKEYNKMNKQIVGEHCRNLDNSIIWMEDGSVAE